MDHASSNEEDRKRLEASIAEEEANISGLAAELDRRRATLASLRERQSANVKVEKVHSLPGAATTRGEKIRLFRSLFRGREDVFARRWESSKTGSGLFSGLRQ